MTIAGNQGQNVYPSPENYPTSSFPQPVPAPDVDPDDAGTLISVQYSWQWREVLMAAIDQLLNPATWPGDHDAVILAVDRAILLKDLLQTDRTEIEAPYWDDADGEDADVQLPPNAESWFGYLEGANFVDDLAGWVFVGAVALSFGVDAAIEFATGLKRLRLLFRTGSAGAIVEVLVDGLLSDQVDTYSPDPGLVAVDVYPMPAGMGFRAFDVDDPVLIDIKNTGTANEAATPVDGLYSMQVIKKRLWEAEIFTPALRYDDTTDEVQQTFDGGATWVDQPGQDPRHADIFRFPVIVADDPRCQAAANMSRSISDFLHSISGIASEATNAESMLTIVIAGVAVFFPEVAAVGVLAFLALDLASTIFSATFGAVDSAFTNDVFDQLTCIFYCHIAIDGSVDADQLAAILSDVNLLIGGLVYTVLQGYFFLVGEVGLSNMGAKGDAPADCSGCECGWSRCWDFSLSGDLLNLTLNEGTYDPGHSYLGVTVGAETAIVEMQSDVITEFRCTKVTLTYSMSDASPSNGGIDIRLYNGATLVVEWHELPAIPGAHQTWTWEGDENITQVLYTVSTGTLTGATCGLEKIRMEGFGDAPDLGGEC